MFFFVVLGGGCVGEGVHEEGKEEDDEEEHHEISLESSFLVLRITDFEDTVASTKAPESNRAVY